MPDLTRTPGAVADALLRAGSELPSIHGGPDAPGTQSSAAYARVLGKVCAALGVNAPEVASVLATETDLLRTVVDRAGGDLDAARQNVVAAGRIARAKQLAAPALAVVGVAAAVALRSPTLGKAVGRAALPIAGTFNTLSQPRLSSVIPAVFEVAVLRQAMLWADA